MALSESEFAQQQGVLGEAVHYHDGVWWKRTAPFYCTPVFEYRRIAPGEAKPNPLRSLLGYSHLTPCGQAGGDTKPRIVLEGDGLRNFSIKSLASAERAQIRKAARLLSLREVRDLEEVLEDMREINVRQAERTGHGLRPSFYLAHANEWRSYMRRVFGLSGRTWVGAFAGERLVAYHLYYQVEDVVIIDSVKSHTDYLSLAPNSGLLFRMLEEIRDLGTVSMVVYGGPSANPKLDSFKANFLFQRRDLSCYARLALPLGVARSLTRRYPALGDRVNAMILRARMAFGRFR